MSVLAELTDGRLVPVAETVGETCEQVAYAFDHADPGDWVCCANGGAIRAARIVGLWPEKGHLEGTFPGEQSLEAVAGAETSPSPNGHSA